MRLPTRIAEFWRRGSLARGRVRGQYAGHLEVTIRSSSPQERCAETRGRSTSPAKAATAATGAAAADAATAGRRRRRRTAGNAAAQVLRLLLHAPVRRAHRRALRRLLLRAVAAVLDSGLEEVFGTAARAGRATEFCSDFPESVRAQYLEPVQGPRASYANCHGSWDPCECHDQPDGVCDFVHIMRPAKAGAFLSWLGHFLVAIVSASLVVVTLLAREREMRLAVAACSAGLGIMLIGWVLAISGSAGAEHVALVNDMRYRALREANCHPGAYRWEGEPLEVGSGDERHDMTALGASVGDEWVVECLQDRTYPAAWCANTCVVCPDCVGPTRKGYEQCQREAAALIQGRVIGFVIFGFIPWLLIAYFAYCAHGRANELRAARRPERPRGASASTATVTAVPVPTGVPVLTVSGSCGGGVALTAVVAPAPLEGTPVSTVPS